MGRQRHAASPPLADADPAQDRRFVTALARGLTVLRCFGPADRWLAHQELARRTGLPQATVSRLTFTLTSLGYLRHRAATGEYALSPAVLSLGFSVLSNFQIGRIARPFMEALAEHTQAAISLGVRHDTSVVYVAHCRSTARLILGLDVGTRLPFAETAMGRAIWCASTPGMQALIARRLQAEHAVRGYAVSASEWEQDIAAIGVGLDLGDGREALSLTVGGPAARLQGALLHEDFAPALIRTGREIVAAIQAAAWED
jgi:DNA-binding IclR family transcriptional regulator